jgi:heme exporter protein CcmD
MGGYGQYVWPSYLLTVLIVWLNIRWARQSVRKAHITAQRRVETLRSQSRDTNGPGHRSGQP